MAAAAIPLSSDDPSRARVVNAGAPPGPTFSTAIGARPYARDANAGGMMSFAGAPVSYGAGQMSDGIGQAPPQMASQVFREYDRPRDGPQAPPQMAAQVFREYDRPPDGRTMEPFAMQAPPQMAAQMFRPPEYDRAPDGGTVALGFMGGLSAMQAPPQMAAPVFREYDRPPDGRTVEPFAMRAPPQMTTQGFREYDQYGFREVSRDGCDPIGAQALPYAFPASGSFVAEPFASNGAPLYASQGPVVTEAPRERFDCEYRSVSPLPGRGGEYRSVSPLPSRGAEYQSVLPSRGDEYRSLGPIPSRSAPMYDNGYRAGYAEGQPGYADSQPIFGRSADVGGGGAALYAPVSYGAPPPPLQSYGAEFAAAAGTNARASGFDAPSGYGGYGAPAGPSAASRLGTWGNTEVPLRGVSDNYYVGGPQGSYAKAGDTYAGGAISYGPSPVQSPGEYGYGNYAGYGFPTSGSFVAEPFAPGAPPAMGQQALLPEQQNYGASSSFVAPYGAGSFSDPLYGSAAPPLAYNGSFPPGTASPFGSAGPPPGGLLGMDTYAMSGGGLPPGDAFESMDMRRPSSNYYASMGPATANLRKEELREDKALAAAASKQATIDREEGKKSSALASTMSATGSLDKSKQPQSRQKERDQPRRTKKRHGTACC